MELLAQKNSKKELDILDFISVLYGRTSKYTKNKGMAYIAVNQGKWVEYPYNVEKLDTKLLEYIDEDNIYITSNTFMFKKGMTRGRTASNLWQIKFLYADLDIVEKTNYSVDEALTMVWDLIEDNIIPNPTMIVKSGRGLHLYWSIGDYTPTDINRAFWLDIQICIHEKMKHLGADPKVSKDIVRVLRVPSTINSKNNTVVEVDHIDRGAVYTLQGIKDKYFKSELTNAATPNKTKKKLVKATKSSSKRINLFNPYTLHKARYEDLMKLLEQRNYNVYKYRHHFLHLISYYYGLYSGDSLEGIQRHIESINDRLVCPVGKEIGTSELISTVKGAYRYIGNYHLDMENASVLKSSPLIIEYSVPIDQGFNKGDIKSLNYRLYSNSYIIDLLDISSDEMKYLKTLISHEESLYRKNEKRKKDRRNDEGFTPKQVEQMEKRKKAIELKAQGLSIRQIAKEIGTSPGAIQNLLK